MLVPGPRTVLNSDKLLCRLSGACTLCSALLTRLEYVARKGDIILFWSNWSVPHIHHGSCPGQMPLRLSWPRKGYLNEFGHRVQNKLFLSF